LTEAFNTTLDRIKRAEHRTAPRARDEQLIGAGSAFGSDAPQEL
jgi:hypothetical protein